jgi:multidrug efflux system membrane fusion protein
LGHRSPTIDILGSYFPAWMVCIISGLTLTLITHWIVQVCKLKPYIGPPALIYSCLMIIFTFATWILFYVLEKAKADLAALDRQIAQAHSTLQRLEPLLANRFTTAESVDEARTKETTLQAQREGVVASINLEELHVSYCKVIAPFSGRVINLNISAGAHVTTGVPVFSLLDTSKWYVIANFREAEVRHMAPGSEAIVYLSSAPNQRFRGKVQGIGWAVKPEGEIDLPPSGVPYVKRELNWVRVAQRFPVRIEVENPDPNLFRMGASAVAIIDGPAPDK